MNKQLDIASTISVAKVLSSGMEESRFHLGFFCQRKKVMLLHFHPRLQTCYWLGSSGTCVGC